jgi:multiple sugar transport system ATP-binding protein
MSALRLRAIRKNFGGTVAVDDVTLDVPDRKFLVLLGPSGCGKTTIMRLIAGLEKLTAGEIWIGDKCMNRELPRDRDVAMVFQSYALYPHMSVYENIEYPLRVRKMPFEQRRAAALDAARKVELEALLDRLPRELSGGQRQRVALARAIVRRPQVFLMDEPLSNLDARLRVKMRSELKHLHHMLGITTVYVTHDQSEALTLADQIAVMAQGRVMQLADPKTLYDRPANAFVAGFVGSLSMNFITGEFLDGSFRAAGINVPGIGIGTRKGVKLGIRPNHLEIVASRSEGHFSGELYSVEVTGEAAIATVRFGKELVSVIVGRDYTGSIGQNVPLRITEDQVHFFDDETGERLSFT